MKTMLLTALAGAAGTSLVASTAFAASFDVSNLANLSIADVCVPVLTAIAPVVSGVLVLPLRRFLDQKAGDLLASRVNDLLDKAIAYAAAQAEAWVTQKDFHVQIDGWLTSIAADYAVGHASDLLNKAGAFASGRASDLAKQAAADLLKQKVVARLIDHPAVVALKAKAGPAPVAAAAA